MSALAKVTPKDRAKLKLAPIRRTQEERREGTIRKLLDAAADALIDIGYADASVQVICAGAGVSQGALFRHFPTREALMVAVGADIGQQTLRNYQREFEELLGTEDPVVLALRLVRAHCRSRLNQAWYELAVAARTHESLRLALEPIGKQYYVYIEALARQLLPDAAKRTGKKFGAMVQTILATFDGESMHRFVSHDKAMDDARIELLAAFIASHRG